MNRRIYEEEARVRSELSKRNAHDRFDQFLGYINKTFQLEWFHHEIARKCQSVLEGYIDRKSVV